MLTRRTFLRGAAAAACASPWIRSARVRAEGTTFASKHVVVLGIAGGLRLSESLGMSEGATFPNLLGDVPLIPGFGAGPAGAVRIAPEYAAATPMWTVPAPLATPLRTQGALITNLRYAEGAPGHLQGHACLVSGAYNNIENRGDAAAPAPTLFELHRRRTNAAATDAWTLSNVGGFYRVLRASDHPEYGSRFGGTFFSPPGLMTPILPIVAGGQRLVEVTPLGGGLPVIANRPEETAATRRLTAILDANSPAFAEAGAAARLAAPDAHAFEDHLATYFSDTTYDQYFPDSVGIGTVQENGDLEPTGDALTVYHAMQVLAKFKPAVMSISLIDIDACHDDYNGYLRGQVIADACARWLWESIQATPGLAGETTLLIVPEHGRHLFMNGNNPDSLGRSGIDHGVGDDGDRDVWMMALGPDIKAGAVEAPTGVTQAGRTSGRLETIDVIRTAAALLGCGDDMDAGLDELGHRRGLVIGEVLA